MHIIQNMRGILSGCYYELNTPLIEFNHLYLNYKITRVRC